MITRRQALIGAVSIVVAARSIAQPRTYRIGLIASLEARSRDPDQAFLAGLRELGYREGQNLIVERRYIEGRLDRLPALATELAMGLELLPDKTKTWAQIQSDCRVFDGGYDEGIKPIRDGVKKLVDAVLARKKAGKRKF